jgi:hypothetical protein
MQIRRWKEEMTTDQHRLLDSAPGVAEAPAFAPPTPRPGNQRKPSQRSSVRRRLVGALALVVVLVVAGIIVYRYSNRPAAEPASLDVPAKAAGVTKCDAAPGKKPPKVCFGSKLVLSNTGFVELLGYFGGPGYGAISGARIELLAGSGRALKSTGDIAVTDSRGRFAFAVRAVFGQTSYGFRFPSNAYYPLTASRVLTVDAH